MSADEQRFTRFAGQRRPEIASDIVMNFDPGQQLQFRAQPFSRLCPSGSKSHALRAVFVPSERAQLFELGNRSLRI